MDTSSEADLRRHEVMEGIKVDAAIFKNDGGYYVKKPIPVKAVQIPYDFWVESLEGNHQGHAGDYLIQGVKGELYICQKDIFEETYQPRYF
jgi:hypothetical protein